MRSWLHTITHAVYRGVVQLHVARLLKRFQNRVFDLSWARVGWTIEANDRQWLAGQSTSPSINLTRSLHNLMKLTNSQHLLSGESLNPILSCHLTMKKVLMVTTRITRFLQTAKLLWPLVVRAVLLVQFAAFALYFLTLRLLLHLWLSLDFSRLA